MKMSNVNNSKCVTNWNTNHEIGIDFQTTHLLFFIIETNVRQIDGRKVKLFRVQKL